MTTITIPGIDARRFRNPALLPAHIDLLCEEHHIIVEWISRSNASAKGQLIRIQPVTNVRRYSTALHEIGHLVGRGARGGSRLSREAMAWWWALRNAMEGTITQAFIDNMSRSLLSYLVWACARNDWEMLRSDAGYTVTNPGPARVGCPSLPPADHLFWGLLNHPEASHHVKP